jgi:hypothetical protein
LAGAVSFPPRKRKPGETKTEAIRKTIEERKARPQIVRDDRTEELMR